MVNYSAYWQAQQRKQSDSKHKPQNTLKQPKKGVSKETSNSTHGEHSNSVMALA